MEQKRKIVIPLGGSSRGAGAAPQSFDGEQTVPAPLFDAEATLGAQPVVPLAEANSSGAARRLPLIALLVVLAVGAGVAGGFAIGVYKSRQNRQEATATNATTTTAATTASSGSAAQPSAQLPVLASEKSSEPPARTTATDDTTERSSSARDKKSKTDDEQVIPPVEIRERSGSSKERREAKSERSGGRKDDDDDEERVARRQRREQRRRARQADEQDADLNQQIERAGREVNRIREIFEGQRP